MAITWFTVLSVNEHRGNANGDVRVRIALLAPRVAPESRYPIGWCQFKKIGEVAGKTFVEVEQFKKVAQS